MESVIPYGRIANMAHLQPRSACASPKALAAKRSRRRELHRCNWHVEPYVYNALPTTANTSEPSSGEGGRGAFISAPAEVRQAVHAHRVARPRLSCAAVWTARLRSFHSTESDWLDAFHSRSARTRTVTDSDWDVPAQL